MVTVLSILIVPWNEKSRKKGAKVYTKHRPQRLIVSPLSLPWPGLFHLSLMSFKPWIWPSSPGPKMPKQNVQWFKQWCWKHSQQKQKLSLFRHAFYIFFHSLSHFMTFYVWHLQRLDAVTLPGQETRPPEIDGFSKFQMSFPRHARGLLQDVLGPIQNQQKTLEL